VRCLELGDVAPCLEGMQGQEARSPECLNCLDELRRARDSHRVASDAHRFHFAIAICNLQYSLCTAPIRFACAVTSYPQILRESPELDTAPRGTQNTRTINTFAPAQATVRRFYV